jgi:hypothetical protein
MSGFPYNICSCILSRIHLQTLKRASTPLARYGTLSARYGTLSAWYGTILARYGTVLARYATLLARYAYLCYSHTKPGHEPDFMQLKMGGNSPGIDSNLHTIRVETARFRTGSVRN